MLDQNSTTLRFGIMVDDLSLEAWKIETLRKLIDGGMTLALVIQNGEQPERENFFKKILHYPYRKMFFQIWNHYQFKPDCKVMKDLKPMLAETGLILDEIPSITCVPEHLGTSTFFSNHDVEFIKNQNLDFILRFGFNIVRGDILQVATFGIWSFHHDDEMEYRGGPPGFWEWMHDDPRNGIILQQLTESLDKGYILQKRWYPTILHSYKAHLNQLYFESTDMPLQVCREIIATGNMEAQLSTSKATIYHAPKNGKMLSYWIKCITRRIRFHLHDLLKQEDWDVAYAEVPLKKFVEAPIDYDNEIRWFRRKRRSQYYADPFVITTERDTYIFFEDYDYKIGKGVIDVAKYSEKFKKFHLALEEPFHLSYPSVFEHDGTIYCLPEANESGRLNLYRFNEDTLKLEFDSVLLDGIRAVDPTLLFDNGTWNLFLTQKDFPSVKLYRYLSDNLRGPYTPFAGNPVKVDCADARMAGNFFEYNGQLTRPAQECIRYYGTAVNLNTVNILSDTRYKETQLDKIEPFKRSHFKQGLHTLNGNDVLTVFDGKRWEFTFSGFSHQWQIKKQQKKQRKNSDKELQQTKQD